MRKLFIALALLTFTAATAEAQNYQNRNGYNRGGGYAQQYRGGHNAYRNNGNRYVQNNYYGRRGNGWNNGGAIAAGVGIGLLGGILGSALINQPAYGYPQPVYPASPVYPGCTQNSFYNQYGQRVVQTVCP